MATETILYVVQIKKSGHWRRTYWTRQARPVSKRYAKLALERAQLRYPEEEYRLAPAKPVEEK